MFTFENCYAQTHNIILLYLLSVRPFLILPVRPKRLPQQQEVMRGSRGGTGGPNPPGKSQKYRDFSSTGPGPLKITKLPSQHSMLDHH